MAAAAIDMPYLASFASVPESTITSLLEDPTVELVKSFLSSVALKAKEFDQLKAKNLRLDVELENAIRTGESKTKSLKNTVEKGLAENATLRDNLQKEETARATLESQLEDLKSSTSNSSSESSSLKARITSLESSNRDTLGLLESKTTAYDELAKELSAQHQKTVELRRHVSSLEQKIQADSSSAATTRLRIQSLEQEVELVKKNSEWYQSELRAKQEEYMKFRKEKGAKAAELQRINEDMNSNVDALKRTEATLRSRLAEVEQKFEDSLLSIQQLQEDATKVEENHRLQLDRTTRLAQLQERSAATERRRVQEFQEALDHSKDEAAEEIARLRAEMETEHSEKAAAEERVIELESTVDRLESELSEMRERPMTPIRGMNGAGSNTPSRTGTPSRAFSPTPSRLKGNMSMTQMYSEYSAMKSQLIKAQRSSEEYKTALDDVIRDLETLRPEVEDLRTRNTSLLEEMNEMSAMLENYSRDKDAARKESRKAESEATKLLNERNIHKQQVLDLSAQVRYLLMQNHILQQGIESMSQEDLAELEKVARGEIDEQAFQGLTDTGRLISESLIIFKNVTQLQEKNVQLTRMLREITDRMESAEAREKENIHQREHAELVDLRGRIQGFEDEAKSMNVRAQGYLKERDMYRRLLSNRGQLPPDASSVLGDSSVPATPTAGGNANAFDSPSSKDLTEYKKLIKDLQAHLDAMRQESQTDMQTLRQQVDNLSRDKGSLQSDVARVNGQLSLATQRNEMLQGNYNMLRTENDTLQKRSQSLMENATKQDLRTQQAIEELVEVKSLMDSMRNETANLKAEKGVWKSIEQRLMEDNESLRNERNRLNGLNSNLQVLINEKEQSDSEIRRRQQTTIDNLESDLQSTRRKLNDEIEEAKKSTLRKDYDQQQSQKRIDDLMTALGNVREELASAKTTRDHLQAKVDELEIDIKSAEERIAALQPKPTGAATGQDSEGQPQEGSLTREQELAVEVSELKRELEMAKSEVERTKEQVEQYKSISQETEEQLQSLNDASDQYREETDRDLAEKDKKIKDLQQRIDDIESELATSNSELSSLQDEKGDLTRKLNQQKSEFEAEISRLKDEGEQNVLAAKFHQENLKAQAEIAQKAQQDYEDELVKHSEATQQLRSIRAEANELKANMVDLKATAESTKATLAQKEESWNEIRNRYDADLADLKKRREEVQHQNDILHGQLETVGQQIAALRQERASVPNTDAEDDSSNWDLAALQEVIAYLRREKAITEVQYDIVQSDVRRLQREVDHANAQLDELRLKQSQDHQRGAENERNVLDQTKLLDAVAELNLYRESSVTLRSEARRAEASLAEKSQLVDDLQQQIQPLQAKIQELEDVKETQAGEMRLLQEDRDRWRERTNNIMSKYDRVDPEVLESLKKQVETLTTERDEAVGSTTTLQEQIVSLGEQAKESEERWQRSRTTLIDQAKSKARDQANTIKNVSTDLQNAIAEKDALQQQLDSSKQALVDLKSEHSEALSKASAPSVPHQQVDTPMQNGMEDGQVMEEGPSAPIKDQIKLLEETISQLEEKVRAAEGKADSEAARADELQKQVDRHVTEVEDLNRQITEAEADLKRTQEKVNELLQSASQSTGEDSEEVTQIREQLVNKDAEIGNLKAQVAVNSSVASVALEEGAKPVAEQIQEQVDEIRTKLENQHNERLKALEDQYTQRSERMKAQMNKILAEKRDSYRAEGRDSARKEIEAEHIASLEKLRSEYEASINSLNQKHQDEMTKLKEDGEIRLRQEKAIWQAEQSSQTPQRPQQAKNEPPTPSGDLSNITETQARDLVKQNPIIRQIMIGNINSKVKSEKDALSTKLNEEHQQAIVKKVAEAVNVEEKKNALKVNLAIKRERTAVSKIAVVEQAAKETPERPVGEVWEIAKAAQPAPTAAPAATSTPAPVPTAPSAPVTKPAAATVAPAQNTPATRPPPPNPSPTGQPTQIPQPGQGQGTVHRGNFGVPTPISTVQRGDTTSGAPSVQGQAPQPSPSTASPRNQAPQQPSQTQSGLPVKPPQGQLNHAQQAVRGAHQSRLPTGGTRGARGGFVQNQASTINQTSNAPPQQDVTTTFQNVQRGRGAAPRGTRGSGIARGGMIPQPSGPVPNTRAPLNPSAAQYVPQSTNTNKRPREDGQDGQDNGNGGKRARSSGGSG